MGELRQQPESEVERLQAEADKQLKMLMATLHRLDAARAKVRGRHATPAERRKTFRVIEGGGAVIVAVLLWIWEAARRPALAVAAGTSAVTAGAVMLAPMIEPGTAAEPLPAIVTRAPVEAVVPGTSPDERRDPATTPTPVARTPAPTVTIPLPEGDAAVPPTVASPTPTVSPTPTPTASATVEVAPLVEVEVSAENQEACVASELTGLELALCLDGVR
jgi:hypothetical protein